MFPNMIEANPPTTQAAIEDFERKHEIVLPQLYREFLLATNGGRPKNPVFPIRGMPLNPAGSIQFFFGVEN